ncbi:hypothetical protein CEXT_64511 [Caerostris extrusa]|uniref:Uncharacterized protein n=1 Tax=Caerostris extrusa TaxID=172846 RepID=A0AAV4R0G7_CAEEX|nr:hypothetical protein CEXT_64511 [Caerostris extrusa]
MVEKPPSRKSRYPPQKNFSCEQAIEIRHHRAISLRNSRSRAARNIARQSRIPGLGWGVLALTPYPPMSNIGVWTAGPKHRIRLLKREGGSGPGHRSLSCSQDIRRRRASMR